MISRPPLETLRRRYPWPHQRPPVAPIDWTFDGGGRRLVIEEIRKCRARVVLEIGCWLGGSVKNWLAASPDVQVIALDHWTNGWGDAARAYGKESWIADQLDQPEGPYLTFLANLWDHRRRIIPVRGSSAEKLFELHELGVAPDLIYLDADKSGREIPICHLLFPDATITGDDWQWGPEQDFPIREPVFQLCQKHNYHLFVERSTWVISSRPPSLRHRLAELRRRVFAALDPRRRRRLAESSRLPSPCSKGDAC